MQYNYIRTLWRSVIALLELWRRLAIGFSLSDNTTDKHLGSKVTLVIKSLISSTLVFIGYWVKGVNASWVSDVITIVLPKNRKLIAICRQYAYITIYKPH